MPHHARVSSAPPGLADPEPEEQQAPAHPVATSNVKKEPLIPIETLPQSGALRGSCRSRWTTCEPTDERVVPNPITGDWAESSRAFRVVKARMLLLTLLLVRFSYDLLQRGVEEDLRRHRNGDRARPTSGSRCPRIARTTTTKMTPRTTPTQAPLLRE